MSYREKNFKGLLFFNILHFNVGLIILAFIAMAISSIVFTHNNIRKSEELLMKNMVQNIISRKKEIENITKDIDSVVNDRTLEEEIDRYLNRIVSNRDKIKKIGIIDTPDGLNSQNLENLELEINQNKELIKEVIKSKHEKYIQLDNKNIMVLIPSTNSDRTVVLIIDDDYFNIIGDKNFSSIITNNDLSTIYSKNDKKLSGHQKKEINEAINEEINGNGRFIYYDKNRTAFYSGYVEEIGVEDGNDFKIIIEHNVLKELKANQCVIFIIGIIIIGIISAVLLSLKIYDIIREYLNLITRLHQEVGKGNYSFNIPEKYQMKEWQAVFDNITKMSKKIEEREMQLSLYNTELMKAHDSIESMYKKIKSSEIKKRTQFFKVISSMLNLIELKDEYTAGHSIAVTKYSNIIAREMNEKYGYDIDEERLKVGAILHDIGKIGIDENVLNKPSKLDDKEIEIIKNHPNNGAEALTEISKFDIERDIIKYHHEKYDGTGYPCGLKGEEIPLEARIVSVADAFDAMTSDRPYRAAMSLENALEELISSKGKQFDPKIVDITVILIQRKKIELHNYKSIAM